MRPDHQLHWVGKKSKLCQGFLLYRVYVQCAIVFIDVFHKRFRDGVNKTRLWCYSMFIERKESAKEVAL